MGKTKGLRRPERTALIDFPEEDDDLHGLEITLLTSVGMAFVYDMLTRAFAVDDEDAANIGDKLRGAEQDMRDFAAGTLHSWNLLDDDGNPVPATPDEFVARLSQPEAARIFWYWVKALRTVPAPLAPPSESGDTSEEPKESPSPQS